jgi:nucleotide-binding universal stress UspA family protein
MDTRTTDDGAVVVVGVDGSDGSKAALRFALDEARRRSATLRVVTVWEFPATIAMGMVLPPDFDDVSAQAAEHSAQAAIDQLGEAGVPVELKVLDGNPAGALIAQARDADVLVVGSRGRGGFRELLLGSVSQACVHHAGCPVVVIRHHPAPQATAKTGVGAASA